MKFGDAKSAISSLKPYLSAEEVLEIQNRISSVYVSDALVEYVQQILDFTRTSSLFFVGLSPRAGMAVLQAARSRAFLSGRDHVLPEDVQSIFPWVVGHRLRSADDLREIARDKLISLFMEIPIP